MKKTIIFAAMAALCLTPKVNAQDDPDSKYIRNSVYMIKLDVPTDNQEYAEAYKIMDKTFDGIDFAKRYERYNDFSLKTRHIDFSKIEKADESEYEELNKYCAPDNILEKENAIKKTLRENVKTSLAASGLTLNPYREEDFAGALIKYFNKEAFANKLVAKWHNKPNTPEGKVAFDDNLSTIMELGLKGLSEEAKANAKATENLTALVGNSENKLLSNTYVCVNRYGFMNAQEIMAFVVVPLEMKLQSVLGNPLLAKAAQLAVDKAASAVQGYFVRANAYLFKLDWNKDTYDDFYSNMWGDAANYYKKANYKLIYVGKSSKRAPASMGLSFNSQTEHLIQRATLRGTDAAFAALQRDNEDFRPMCSLHVIDGKLGAYIGMKEGIKAGDKFNVYEAVASKSDPNVIEWKSVGTLKVAKKSVWDNREGAGEKIEGAAKDKEDEEAENANLTYTIFDGKPGKFGEGNMIRLAK